MGRASEWFKRAWRTEVANRKADWNRAMQPQPEQPGTSFAGLRVADGKVH